MIEVEGVDHVVSLEPHLVALFSGLIATLVSW